MAVNWTQFWCSSDNNDVDKSLGKQDILKIITSIHPSILRVQPAVVREAVNLVIADSPDVTIIKGLHDVGSEKIDIKKTGGTGGDGPVVHLYCMRYRLVDLGRLRFPADDDMLKEITGWRITGSSAFKGDGDEANQGMDKTGEIDKLRKGQSKSQATATFRALHY